MKNKTLTRAEEQVMQYLWSLGKGFLKDIIEQFPNPKPAYTTVSTVIRVLVRKKFIGFKTYGKVNEYYPLIPKQAYFNTLVKPIISNYFEGSSSTFASYFANEQLTLTELEEMRHLIDDRIKKIKNKKK